MTVLTTIQTPDYNALGVDGKFIAVKITQRIVKLYIPALSVLKLMNIKGDDAAIYADSFGQRKQAAPVREHSHITSARFC